MIRVQRVTKQFGTKRVVDKISFTVAAGETLVLLGPSGCGKTTTLKMLNRLLEPDEGEIFINGKNIKQLPPEELRRGIGYVIQQGGLFPHYTVEENIAIVPRLLKWPEPAIKARVEHLLTAIGLSPDDFLRKYPHQLSGGQSQRVGLARALAADPPVVLMDEPFGALDPITRHRIQQEFREVEELKQKTIVLVTHDITEAILLADRIALMNAGQLLQIGTPKELLLQPATPFVRQFFDHGRRQLEWMVRPLGELLGEAREKENGQANVQIFEAGQSIWDVLETIPPPDDTTGMIGIRTNTGIHYIPWTEFLRIALSESRQT